jgi:hypothetical protein
MTATADRTERRPQHVYVPRGSQVALMECRAPEVLMSGPAGTGKSRACLEKLHFAALLNPGMRGLIVRKTLASLGSTALDTWRKYVATESMANGDLDFYGGSPEEPPQYRYTNGSVVIIGGMDRAIRIMSSEYDMIYVQEATELTKDDWEALTTRLRNGVVSFQQLMGDANPNVPTHWLKSRCDDGTALMFDSRHEENPILFREDGSVTERGAAYMAKLDALTGVRKQRLRHGRWVAAEGLIYDEWDAAVHLVPRFPVPREWPRIWSIDFGYTNPFVWQCWVEDPDGRLYLQRELYRSKRTVDRHARDILELVSVPDPDWHPAPDRDLSREPLYAHEGRKWTEPRPDLIIADHDAEGRAVLDRELGLISKAARKDVIDGIQAVQRRLLRAGDGKPRLFLMADARPPSTRDEELADAGKPTCTADEIVGYVWKPQAATVVGEQRPAPEEPMKKDDHGMDPMRYVVAERDLGARTRLRWM